MRPLSLIVSACFVLTGCSEVRVPNKVDSDSGTGDGSTDLLDATIDPGECPIGAICDVETNYAFVSSTRQAPGSLEGLKGADMLCEELAQAAGLPETGYIAWLSDGNNNARARLEGASGWIRPDGRPFALGQTELLVGDILYPLNLDELGREVVTGLGVVTGTSNDGTGTNSNHCEGWTKQTGQGLPTAGIAVAVDGDWTQSPASTRTCGANMRIYCLGTGFQTSLEVPPTQGRLAWISNTWLPGDASIEGMDNLCKEEGMNQGIGSVKALIASGEESAMSRFNTGRATWVRPDGVVLWDKAEDIASRGPLAPIGLELSEERTSAQRVWTGAINASAVAIEDSNCSDWGSKMELGLFGRPTHAGVGFFGPVPTGCEDSYPVYCLED